MLACWQPGWHVALIGSISTGLPLVPVVHVPIAVRQKVKEIGPELRSGVQVLTLPFHRLSEQLPKHPLS